MISFAKPSRARKNRATSLIAIAFIGVYAFFPRESFGQEQGYKPARLVAGTISTPPFAIKTAEGDWEGLSISLLAVIAPALGVEYEVREYQDIEQLFDALKSGEIDIVPVLAAREEAEAALDLTQSYYRSGLGIAVSGNTARQGWLGYLKRLEAKNFLVVVGLLILLWLIAGAGLWLVERRRNSEMFGDGPVNGMGHAVWWAAVTMTTVGYGDKAPKTPGGRIIAIIWMFASILLISSFTASISASLTAEKLVGKVRGANDLPHARVGALSQSESFQSLARRKIAAQGFLTIDEGLQAVADNNIDAFVFDEAVLKNVVASKFAGHVKVLPVTFEHYYVSMGVQNASPLREPINRALLKFMATDEWPRLLDRTIAATQ